MGAFLTCAVCAGPTPHAWDQMVAFMDDLWPTCSEQCFRAIVAQKVLAGFRPIKTTAKNFWVHEFGAHLHQTFEGPGFTGVALLYTR